MHIYIIHTNKHRLESANVTHVILTFIFTHNYKSMYVKQYAYACILTGMHILINLQTHYITFRLIYSM